MNPESDDKYVYNLICCGFLRYDMKERRSIRPVTKERYDTLSQLTNDTFNVNFTGTRTNLVFEMVYCIGWTKKFC